MIEIINYESTNHKKVRVAMLIADQVNFKTWRVLPEIKEGTFL